MTYTIQRAPKDKEHPYVMISRALLDDKISLKLKGLLAFCLSKTDNWNYNVEHLSKVLGESDESIRKLMKEGIESGYITKVEIREKGKFKSIKYYVYEDKIKKIKPQPEKPDTVLPDTENPEHSNKGEYSLSEYLVINEKNNTPLPPKGDSAKADGDSVFLNYSDKVKLKKSDYEKLCADHSKSVIDEIIIELDDYIKSTGKKYQDYAATIRSWLRRRKENPIKQIGKQQIGSQHLAQGIISNYRSPGLNVARVEALGKFVLFEKVVGKQTRDDYLKYDEKCFVEKLDQMLRDHGFILV